MKRLLKIDNIMFYVKDLEKSANFYENVLGLRKRWTDKKRKMIGFTFKESDSEIVIHNDLSLPRFDFSFLVENVVDFCNEFKTKGYKIIKRPHEVRPGMYAILEDLDGNEIRVIDLTKFGGKPRYDG